MRHWFLMNIMLSLIWVALTGSFTYINFTFGYLLSYGVIIIIGRNDSGKRYTGMIPKLIGFVLYFLYQLVKANIQVAFDVVTPHNYMKPGVVAIPLDARSDMEITLLANVISLTPGTLSLDVSTDRKVLYVHSMYVESEEAFIKEIKNGFERRLLEIMR